MSDSEWSDDELGFDANPDDESERVKCIFTEKYFKSAPAYYQHLQEDYAFDVWAIVQSDLQLDFFGYVKLVNYLRTHFCGQKPPSSQELLETKESWSDKKYLKPVIPDDPLLQFMIDNDDDSDSSGNAHSCSFGKEDTQVVSDPNESKEIKGLKNEVSYWRSKSNRLQCQLSDTISKMNQMKNFMKDCILTGKMYRPVSACRMQQADACEEEEFEDSGYFGSYSHHEIHAEMLQDQVRTKAYQDAILQNSDVFKNKIVLDVGCGTGILSMFAAKAGAAHVYAVDMSDVAYNAMDIVRENNLADKITVIKGFIEEITLPVTHVDIIISEWMGYFLLYESMLDSVLYATSKWLVADGLLFPDNCTVNLVAVDDQKLLQNQVGFWDDVYGFKMTCLKEQCLAEATIQIVDPNTVMTDSAKVLNIDLYSTQPRDLNYKSSFSLTVLKTGQLSAIVGYFDCLFKKGIKKPISFTTAPCCKGTHWKQTVFFIKSPLEVKKGDLVNGSISCHKHPKDPRSLNVELIVGSTSQTFVVS